MKLRALARVVGLAALAAASGCKREPARTGAPSARGASADAAVHPLAGQAYSTWSERPGVCSLDFWCWQTPVPQGQPLLAGWTVPDAAGETWFVGEHTTLLHLRGQDVVSSVPTELDVTLRGIWGSSARDIWAVGDDVILHSDGVTWARATLPDAGALRDVWGKGPREVWFAGGGPGAGTGTDAVWFYDGERFVDRRPAGCRSPRLAGDEQAWLLCTLDDGGEHLLKWSDGFREVVRLPQHADALFAVAGQVWIAGQALWRWDGQALVEEPLPEQWLSDAHFGVMGSNLVVAAGVNVWSLPLRGGTPVELVHQHRRSFDAVVGAGADPAWLIDDGELFRLPGGKLSPVFAEDERGAPHSLWGSSGSDVWAANGWLSHFDGQRWSAPERRGASVVWGSSATDVWAIGEFIEHWDGTRWSKLAMPAELAKEQRLLLALHGSGPRDVWLLVRDRLLVHWDGARWSVVPGVGAGMRAVWARSGSEAWLVGAQGKGLRWDGKQWSPVETGVTRSLSGLFGVADDVWAVGLGGTILRWQAGAWHITPSSTEADLRVIWGPRDKELWAAGDVVVKWDGKQWKMSPTRPSSPIHTLWGPGRADAWMSGVNNQLWRRLAYPD